MLVTLDQSKTDPFRKGCTVRVYANGGVACPFTAFHEYMARVKSRRNHQPVFVHQDGRKVERQWVTNQLRKHLGALGYDPYQYAGHSFRKGGATSLAEAGVPDSLIKEAGRWKSVTYQRYIKVSHERIREAFGGLDPAGLGSGNPLQGFGGTLSPHHPPKTTINSIEFITSRAASLPRREANN
jgi:site-specific recombinase XerD